MDTLTVLPGSAVPAIAGVAVLTSAPGAVSTGAEGAMVSTVNERGLDELIFPTSSEAWAVTE
jgi:hypothetical protein